jgi:hypothetical protein
MRPIAKWPVLRIATPAQGILLLDGKPRNRLPGSAITFVIIADFGNNERDPAGHKIGSVFADGDFHGIVFRVLIFFCCFFHFYYFPKI